jgi:predicted nucleic acid-binding protein
MSYLRTLTHPRIFTKPVTPDEALANVRELASLPQARLIAEREGFLEIYPEVTARAIVRANLVPDAHPASILRQHGVSTLYTSNVEDFRKIGFPDALNPLD